MTIIYFCIMLGVLIAIHEAGHMLMAKAFNMYVKEFSIGFGPKLFSHQGKETLYSLRLIPLGGFTGLIETEDDNVDVTTTESQEETTEQKKLVSEDRTFFGCHPLKRIAVLLAGPLSNVLLAFVIFITIFLINGQEYVYPKPIIGEVVENSAAELAGIQVNDEIISIDYSNGDHVVTGTTYDISINNQMHKGEMALNILRDGQQITIKVTPSYDEETKSYLIGIVFEGEITVRKLSFTESIVEGIDYTIFMMETTVKSIVLLFQGQTGIDSLSGTIGIYSYTKEAVSYGFISYLSLVGSISISLAIMNLIPIPIFDGGRVVLCLIELITGRRLNKKVENVILVIGLLMIIALFAFTTFLDISRLFK